MSDLSLVHIGRPECACGQSIAYYRCKANRCKDKDRQPLYCLRCVDKGGRHKHDHHRILDDDPAVLEYMEQQRALKSREEEAEIEVGCTSDEMDAFLHEYLAAQKQQQLLREGK